MRRRALALALILAASCSDQNQPFDNSGPLIQAAILQGGAGSSSAHFYFLPPITGAASYKGEFDPTLAPTVVMCAWSGSACSSEVARFTKDNGVKVSLEDQQYSVNWQTANTLAGSTFRIKVLVEKTELGAADVVVARNAADLKNIDKKQFVGVVAGATLPVKFRIEKGAVYQIPLSGGSFQAQNGNINVTIPSGALTAPIGITVVPMTPPTDLPGADAIPGASYEFGPEGTTFAQPIAISIHYDETQIPADIPERNLRLWTYSGGTWHEADNSTVDVDSNVVTGYVTSFSPKIVAGKKPVAKIDVAPVDTTIYVGSSAQLRDTTFDNRGGVLNGRLVTWSSSAPLIISVDAAGRVSALAAGDAVITATSEGVSTTAAVHGKYPVTQFLLSAPSTTIAADQTVAVTAQAAGANGQGLPSAGINLTWSSSAGTVSPATGATDATGKLQATFTPPSKAGTAATVSVTDGTRSGSIVLSTTPGAPTQAQVAAGADQSAIVGTAVPVNVQISVTDKFGNPVPGTAVAFSVTNGGGSIQFANALADANGTATPGSWTLGATPGANELTVTVGGQTLLKIAATALQQPVASVLVTPGSVPVTVNRSVQLSAATLDRYGNVLADRGVAWQSSDAAIATVDQTGLVTAHASGAAKITATSEGISGSADVQAGIPAITVANLNANIAVKPGQTFSTTFQVLNAGGGTLDSLSFGTVWNQWNGTVYPWIHQSIDRTTAPATVTITATPPADTQPDAFPVNISLFAPGASNSPYSMTWQVRVQSPYDATIALSNSTPSIAVNAGDSTSIQISISNTTGGSLTNLKAGPVWQIYNGNQPAWLHTSFSSATAPSVLTITATPPRDWNPGTDLYQFSISGTAQNSPLAVPLTVTVNPPVVSHVTVSPSSATLDVGATLMFSAQITDANGNALTGRTVTWATSDSSVATISAEGLLTARAVGGATVYATSGGVTGTAVVTVRSQPTSLAITIPLTSARDRVAFSPQPVVQITDANGMPTPLAGAVVTATLTSGGGSLGGTTTVVVDANGMARFSDLTLSGKVGPKTITFSAPGLHSTTQTVNLNAGVPYVMAKLSGDGQTALAGALLPERPTVRVFDADANRVPGVTVTFAVATGGGTVTDATQTTDTNGEASVGSWTLGTQPGTNTLNATADTVVRTFSATGTAYLQLIHSYSFSQPGTVQDSLGTANASLIDGVTVSNGMFTNNGGNNGYAQFDQHIVPTGANYSVSMWVRQHRTQSQYVEFISQGFSGGPGFYIGHDPGQQIRVSDSWPNTGVIAPTDLQFHHYAVVVDAAQNLTKLYIDGSLRATLPSALITTNGGDHTRLGAQFSTSGEYLDGDIDDVRIYQSALADADVAALASSGPTKLMFQSQPSTSTSGQLMLSGVTVLVQDALGRTVTSDNSTVVTLAIGSNPGNGTLSGTISAVASAGVVRFNGLSIDQPGINYTLTASGGTLQSATSQTFDIAAPLDGPIVATAPGAFHTCALTSTGHAYCWGENSAGSMGNGSRNSSGVPFPVSGGLTFTSLTSGGNQTCGIATDGASYCWGENNAGQIGNGRLDAFYTNPQRVAIAATFTKLSAGEQFTCGITSAGETYCWGQNSYGALGNGTTTNSATPVRVATTVPFTSLAAGAVHACGSGPAGTYCWGYNASGQLGNGTTTNSLVPTGVTGPLASLTAGGSYTCGIVAGGPALCWGNNSYGELGNGTTTTSLSPVVVQLNGIVDITARRDHTCGRIGNGQTFCWGRNVYGELGDGTLNSHSIPAPISTPLTFTSVLTGGYFTCGIASSGGTYCWGDNTYGNLGIGMLGGSVLTPTRVFGSQ